MGALSGAGPDCTALWEAITGGRTCIAPLRQDGFESFDRPLAATILDDWLQGHFTPEDEDVYDRTARLAIVAITEALKQSGLPVDWGGSDRTGIVMGKCQATLADAPGRYQRMHTTCDLVARRFRLGGPRLVLSTACTAGANAIGAARDKLWSGEADVMIAGGVDPLTRGTFAGFYGLRALSTEPCAPYSRSDGLTLGEGAAFVILERWDDVEERGGAPLAEFLGYGLSADAYHPTAPDPTGRGAALAIHRALDDAALSAGDVDYVNGHGTGTDANDKMERKLMRSVFGPRSDAVPISSTKSVVGHSLGASGAIEAATCVLAVQNGVVPPTVNFAEDREDTLNFVPNRPIHADVRVALTNNYAFGGNNSSLVIGAPGASASVTEPVLDEPRVVVSGLGVVGGLGVGIDEWADALRAGTSAIDAIGSFDAARYGCPAGVEPRQLTGRPYGPPNLWRHLDGLTRRCIAATTLALQDAGLNPPQAERDEIAVIFATASGPASTTSEFDSSVERNPTRASIFSFSGMTLNAPAGAVCQSLRLRGFTTTITHGGASSTLAIETAVELIRLRRASTVVVLAADELCEMILAQRAAAGLPLSPSGVLRPYDDRRDGGIPGSATVAIVLESADALEARRGSGYCELLAVAHRTEICDPDGFDESGTALAATLAAALEQSGTDPAAVDYCAAGADGSAYDDMEVRALRRSIGANAAVSAPKSLTGDCDAASGAINVAVCALAVRDGFVPPTANLEAPRDDSLDHVVGASRAMTVRRAVAISAAPGATYGAVVLGAAG